jgi:hypothetical protein
MFHANTNVPSQFFHSTHTAMISVLMMRACLIHSNTSIPWSYHLGSFLIGSLLDIDHFIFTGSLSLNKATHLGSSRPLGHALITITTMSLLVMFVWKNVKCGVTMQACLLSHQLRDSIRRGLWLWPLNISTPPLPYHIYLLALVAVSFSSKVIINRYQYRNCVASRPPSKNNQLVHV